jgi:hypothetical protein
VSDRVESQGATRALLDLAGPREGDTLYALIDGAAAFDLVTDARESGGQEARPLFQGALSASLIDVAPYLVTINPESGFLEEWSRRVGQSAGFLLVSDADPNTLYAHLRDIFEAVDEDGQQYFFRYYDPRVLRTYLGSSTRDELLRFFGPVRVILAETGDPSVIARHSVGPVDLETVSAQIALES